jgi:serine phosphatase RsbU (regulator of sigma subunit)
MTTAPIPPPKDRLELLYRLSQTFNSSLDLGEVLNRVMDEVISVMQAERGFVMLRDEQGNLAFMAARGIDHSTINEPRFQVSLSIVESVAREGKPMMISDAQVDPRFSMRQSVTILGLRSILCVPLLFQERILGIIFVDNRIQAGIFSQSDLELLTAIAANAAIAIENARLYQLAVEKGRLERELQMARQVQSSMLPSETPQVEGWEFAALWQPARQVAGDYYDFIPVGDGQLGLVIADVSDKGMPAALFMATTRSIIRASLDRAASVAEGIAHANRLLCAESANSMFVTLFCARLDPVTGEITYVNAGHNPPIYYQNRSQADMGQIMSLGRTGMVLGLFEDTPYKEQKLRLKPGDFILFYTDGVTDALNSQEEAYGMDRLQKILIENRLAPAGKMVATLEDSIRSFTDLTAPFDDITVVMVKRL